MKRIITLLLLLFASTTFAADGAFQIYNGKLSFPDGTELKTAPKDGTIIHSGNGSPPSSLVGNIGDYYIDNTNHIMYGPYSGSWGSGVYLVGPQGPLGPQGSIGPQGPAGGPMNWTVVSGNIQYAASNTAYLTTNVSQTTITLPATPVPGDVVKIAASSQSGEWLAKTNAGQFFGGSVWAARDIVRSWTCVASSSDGTKLVAGTSGGQIYTSTDSGVTWVQRGIIGNCFAVTSSSDGTKLVAVSSGFGVPGGLIYTSADSGITWIPRESARTWFSVASSSDGTKLVAVAFNGQIYTSTNSGVSWTARDIVRSWTCVASSSDGTKLVAGTSGGQIYTSTDSGVTWAPSYGAMAYYWSSVASSSDGTKFVAVTTGGQIYTSIYHDSYGSFWAPQDTVRNWHSVASSSDGTKLVTAVSNGQIYTSTDSGLSWIPQSINRHWMSVASSSDGTKLVAVADAGQIYTYPSTATQVSGTTRSVAEFVYAGNGEWLIASKVGTVTLQ